MTNPKCLAHVRICDDYHRGRCLEKTERAESCNYKEKKPIKVVPFEQVYTIIGEVK